MERKYNVGDLYDVDGRKGIVFQTWDEGLHGRIISLDEAEFPWASWDYPTEAKLAEQIVGTDNEEDGMANLRIIERIDGWREKYPAFAWCADHGPEWYLPAKRELYTLYTRDALCMQINRALYEHGGVRINLDDCHPWYLSSTEAGKSAHSDYICIWAAGMQFGEVDEYGKVYEAYVRAFSVF